MTDSDTLVLLHTAPANETTFAALMAEIGPEVPIRHVTDAEVLKQTVVAGGVTPEVAARVRDRIREMAEAGAGLIVCTCSSIGGAAERAGEEVAVPVLRIDRAMAERAIAVGRRILVAACLNSTVEPTEELIRRVAREQGAEVDLRTVVFTDAWARFAAGDREGYVRAVADGLREAAGDAEVVVLAQASMAGAAELCPEIAVPILTSPRLGAEAVVAAYRSRFAGG